MTHLVAGIHHRLPLYGAWLIYGVLLGLAGIGWLIYVTHQTSVLTYAYRYDFLTTYIGARAVADGAGAQLYDPGVQARLGAAAIAPYDRPMMYAFVYPAYNALIFAPLGLLPYGAAFVVWGVANGLLAVGVIGALVRATPATRAERLALGLAAASFMPLLLTLLQGQWGGIVLVGLTGAALALRAGRIAPAGAWLLLGLIKPQLLALPLLALLLDRRRQTLGVFAAGTLGVLIGSLALLGNWVPAYLRTLTQNLGGSATFVDAPIVMHNWRGLVYAVLGTDTGPLAAGLIGLLTGGSLVLVGMLWLPRGPWRHTPWEVRFALAILLGLLVVPHLYLHDMVVALLPGFLLWRASGQALAAPPARLHTLRWLLGLGPLVAWLAQFSLGFPISPFPWYLALLIAVALWTFAAIRSPQPAWAPG